ncbi:mannosyl-oligosaccharide alpha-1,2-mannosidase [Geosmithia morbida]|uniref:Mannosyl-oligosaccharide alpha-1,2-mannosidase n=1 Tax=Geosmithia morbida TaxID=1094350 RepID=A0A9P4YQT4_9HYPO|nr:mannosyl-oligosaccharide alpha-1,2-mannosidase [Geosmithia morbida]KAF4119921.1 mannosyl-oligosaccharide alpha-1,2-mannosidase [Geosmithia morbida]
MGSLCMELMRLSQLTGDSRWFDTSERITNLLAVQQDLTELSGLWLLVVNPGDDVYNKVSTSTLGAMADSLWRDDDDDFDAIIRNKRFNDHRYNLRPKAIESVSVLYRAILGWDLADLARAMLESIDKVTNTGLASLAIRDVALAEDAPAARLDSMKSFWMDETLKYFYSTG